MGTQEKSKTKEWRKLDNAAKVFPATATKKNTKVFRFYCELHEEINPVHLQEALELTLDKFPVFKSVLRRGLFWFYMERNEFIPIVKEERKTPCSPIYDDDRIKYLFRINYYRNRINFEVFHVLTDGTGATYFLKELVKNYLFLAHREDGLENIEIIDEELTSSDQEKDGFAKYYSDKTKKPNKKGEKAHQIRGIKTEYETLQVVEGIVDTKSMLAKAKEYGVSLTVYLTAVFIYAIYEEMSVKQRKRPVAIMVPVNLRNFFPSKSMMNFFGYINPSYKFEQDKNYTLDDIILDIKNYFVEELTEDKMAARMNEYTRLEQNPVLRLAPLQMKNIGIQAGFASVVQDITAIFSNMSVVTMPPEYEPYIKQFGVFTSTHKMELCMCSFKERMVLNFTAYYDHVNIQRNFFRILKKSGVEVERVENQFPETTEEDKKKIQFQQCLNFMSITLMVLILAFNILFEPGIGWGLLGIGAVIGAWVAITTGFRKRKNLLKNSLWQFIILSIVAVIADIALGYRGWAMNYLIPIMNMLLLLFMIVIAAVQKLTTEEYMMYMVVATVLGILTIPLLILGIIQMMIFAVLSISMSIIILSFLCVFRKRALLIELQKNLHI